jgi:peptidoglycan/xylan/chitin deacetylase (PgdA/CDA1 family)
MSRTAATNRVGTLDNFVTNEGTLLEDFETFGDWVKTGTAGYNMAADTTNFVDGTKSLSMTAAAAGGTVNVTKTVAWDLSQMTTIKLSFYLPADTDVQYLKIYMASDSAYSNMYTRQINAAYDAFTIGRWTTVTMSKADFTKEAGSPDWANIVRFRVRLASTAASESPITASIDHLVINSYAKPKVVVTFDDSWSSPYDLVFDYMVAAGVPGTGYIIGNTIDAANHLTMANLHTMYDAGWDIGNHTWAHTNLTELETQAAVDAAISVCQDFLLDNGFTRSAHHISYPYGASDERTEIAMAKYGVLTGRSVRTCAAIMTNLPPDDLFHMQENNFGSEFTVANITTQIDKCMQRGNTLFMNGHKIVEAAASDSTEFNDVNFKLVIDYIKKYQDLGCLEALTISQWYEGLRMSREPAVNRVSENNRS